tara:strand:+ start:78 stop:365 length:288 start_codon:yes stop_codon:yes gene_type:complete
MKTKNKHSQYFISNFRSYVYSFYGKDEGIYKHFFNNNLTWREIKKATEIRLSSNMKLEFHGDSVDRELVRDILFKLRDPEIETEHNFNFKVNGGK